MKIWTRASFSVVGDFHRCIISQLFPLKKFKRMVSRDEYYFDDPIFEHFFVEKVKTKSFCMLLGIINLFWSFILFMKLLRLSGSACGSKSCFEGRLWFQTLDTRQNLQITRKSHATFNTIFRINKCFQRSKQKLFIYFFSFTKQPKNFKNACACTDLLLIK